LGFLTGIRLYATVLGLGIILRMHWFTLPPALSHLNVLAEPWVMVAAAVACTLEFLADKIPWVDSFWDSFHTIIRPVGAALIGTQILGAQEPAKQMALALLCGGVAFAGHSSKAATRLLVNHSPEPVTNVALSIAEDAMVPFGLWMMLKHPLVTCIAVAIFLAIFCWVAPKVFRVVHVEWIAIRSLMSRHLGTRTEEPVGIGDRQISEALQSRLVSLPEEYAEAVRNRTKRSVGGGVFCVAAQNVPGLKNSIGYLCFVDGGALFVAKRLLRYRVFDLGGYSQAQLTPGLLFDTFRFETEHGVVEFDAFKSRKPARASGRPALSHP
jgi:hypothetical protein